MTSRESALTYLYCLVYRPGRRARTSAPAPRGAGGRATASAARATARAPLAVSGAPRGLAGTRRLRALDAGDGLWLVVADAPASRYQAPAIEARLGDLRWVSECAMAHEAVVEHFAAAGTVIPMKLFTLFTAEDRALEHVRRTRASIDRLLERLAGRAEWGVRLVLDEARAVMSVEPRAAAPASGTEFLLRRRQERDAVRLLGEAARQEAERVFESLARRADDARRQTPPADGGPRRVVLDAAFLVPRRRTRVFRAAVQAAAGRLADRGYDVTLTGPWPPYNFVADAS